MNKWIDVLDTSLGVSWTRMFLRQRIQNYQWSHLIHMLGSNEQS